MRTCHNPDYSQLREHANEGQFFATPSSAGVGTKVHQRKRRWLSWFTRTSKTKEGAHTEPLLTSAPNTAAYLNRPRSSRIARRHESASTQATLVDNCTYPAHPAYASPVLPIYNPSSPSNVYPTTSVTPAYREPRQHVLIAELPATPASVPSGLEHVSDTIQPALKDQNTISDPLTSLRLDPLGWEERRLPVQGNAAGPSSASMQRIRPVGRTENLSQAVVNGNLKAARSHLEAGADPNLQPLGYSVWAPDTVLGTAVKNKDTEMVELLLTYNADPNISMFMGRGSALALAVSNNDLQMIDLLIQHGVEVNCPFYGMFGSALAVAAYLGRIDCVNKLLSHGADIYLAGTMNPLVLAALGGKLDIVELLLVQSSPTDDLLDICQYALNVARKKGYMVISACLLAHMNRIRTPAKDNINTGSRGSSSGKGRELSRLQFFTTGKNPQDISHSPQVRHYPESERSSTVLTSFGANELEETDSEHDSSDEEDEYPADAEHGKSTGRNSSAPRERAAAQSSTNSANNQPPSTGIRRLRDSSNDRDIEGNGDRAPKRVKGHGQESCDGSSLHCIHGYLNPHHFNGDVDERYGRCQRKRYNGFSKLM